MKKIVLAGSVCCGKTTIVNILREKGYNVMEEVPRKVIKEEMIKEDGRLPWNEEDFFEFQNIVLSRQIDSEMELEKNDLYFLDRSVYDIIGFYLNKGYTPPSELLHKCITLDYEKIFLIETLKEECFENDQERKESYEQNLKLQETIYSLYKSIRIPLIFIPNTLTPQQRVDIILSNIQ